MKHALALPEGQRIRAVDEALSRPSPTKQALAERIAALLRWIDRSSTRWRGVTMFDETPDALRARKDPLLELGFALDAERRALKDRRDAAEGAALRLRPAWREAVIAEAGRPVAPDANGSLRVTFGRVRGYSPREAVFMRPRTRRSRGVVEKHTGEDPFDVPARVREAFAAQRFGRWTDPGLGPGPGRASSRTATPPAATRAARRSTGRGTWWA